MTSGKAHAGYEFRIYPDPAQEDLLRRCVGCRRFMYNVCLDQIRLEWERTDPRRITAAAQQLEIKALKAIAETSWLKEVPHHVLQQAVRDLHRAMTNFFEGRAGFPKHKKRGRGDTCRFPDARQFDWNDHAIALPKLGWIRLAKHRDVVGRVTSVTVKEVAGAWYAVLQSELPDDATAPAGSHVGPAVGIDLNVVDTIALSDGTIIRLPRVTKEERAAMAALQRQLARQTKGGANRRKTKDRIRRMHARWRRRRMDAIHKATTTIAKNHGMVCVEDLNLKNMTASAKGTVEEPGTNVAQKAGLNRSLADVAMGTILRILGYKVVRWGGTLVAVPPHHTSQDCSKCGHRDAASRVSVEEFSCTACGHAESAHTNAAKNVLGRGRKLAA